MSRTVMKRMGAMTSQERGIFECCMTNLAAEVAYRVDRWNDALDEELKPSITKRRQREMFQAIERLAESYNEGISDAALRYFGGERAVNERDRALGASDRVVPFKRRGIVVRPWAQR